MKHLRRSEKMTNMWMVRAGPGSFLIEDFKKYNLVAIGWNFGDLSDKSADDIYELFRKKYGNTRSAMQVIRFVFDIKIGDFVVSYDNENRTYLLGRVTSGYYHSDKISKTDSANDNYHDVHDVEWLCEISRDKLKKPTQGTLKTQITVFHINDNAKNDILSFYDKSDNEIKQIRTVTLANTNSDSLTLDDAINFLTNVLFNEREGHFHYIRKNINLIGRTLVLFKYEGKLIGKGIFVDDYETEITINNENYNGYFLVEEDSVEVFNDSIDLNELKKYVPTINSLNRDQVIDIKYLDEINLMIKNHLGEDTINQNYTSSEIIRNYLDENSLGDLKQENLDEMFIKFKKEFGPDVLENLEGIDLINKIFLHDGDKSTLCYNLEFSQEYMRGGIGGGSAYKYSLFKSNATQQWMAGSSKNHKALSEREAIEVGTKIRDALVNGAKHIENTNFDSIDEFNHLEEELNEIFSNCIVKPTASWVHKYYVLLFPDKFIDIHAYGMKKDFLYKFRIEPENGYYAMDGQFYQLAKESGVKLYSLLDGRIVNLFFESDNQWKPIEEGKLVGLDFDNLDLEPFISDLKRNIIYFGAPGTGKSYNLNQDKNNLLDDFENNYERVTFHPDYSYANFVGTYKPVPVGNSITYKYVPGPFMRILKKAIDNPNEPYILIIEEINRANVAAVFGEVFQLLDRTDEYESEYPIEASEDMKTYLNQDKIILPSNLFIWATMNSADQGVFPMDTAFKRRWDFKYFSINHNEKLIENTKTIINDEEVNWNKLRKQINDELLSYKINEDKLMGPFFAFNEFMGQEIPTKTFKDIFKNKIIMYLFEDAARARRNDLFSGARTKDYVTYSEICEEFDRNGLKIFKFISDDE